MMAGGCLIGQVWGMGLWSWLLHCDFAASRFEPMGLGAEKTPDFYLVPQFWKKNIYFFRSILPLGNTSSSGCDVSSFLTFLFS